MSDKIYAIGDIHGELDRLKDAVKKVERDGGTDARVVFLGDYIDRGSNSKGVIEYLLDGVSADKKWTCLLGNHDQMFSLFMEDCDIQMTVNFHWLDDRLGGKKTLASYGVEVDDTDFKQHTQARAIAAVPSEHIDFLDSLPRSLTLNDLFFVHAGIRPGVPLEQQNKDDLLWIRGEFLEDTRKHPKLVVHGHTPVENAQHYGNRVNLDTGCGYGYKLTTAVFEGSDCWVLTDEGRSPLTHGMELKEHA